VARDLLIGFGVGAFSGAFGVGGGIILVPVLVLLFHMQQKNAQATSLVMVVASPQSPDSPRMPWPISLRGYRQLSS
jgi:uncharacterized membrane protein YfcA